MIGTYEGIRLVAGDEELPLARIEVAGKVAGFGATWTVTAEFGNGLSTPAESTLHVPLPHSGAVVAMTMKVGEREIVAEIKEREAARIEYEDAKASGHTAAIFEQQRAEIFSIGVGNIDPGEIVTVVITVHDTVTVDGREATLRMPTMIKDRFTPANVPDRDIIDGAGRDDAPVRGAVSIAFAEAPADLVCDSEVPISREGDSLVINGEALRGDIVVHWSVPEVISTAKWVADPDDPGMGTLEVDVRLDEPGTRVRRRKAVQIMLDRSGSMGGACIEWARRITSDVIATLAPDDLLHVLTFDDVIEALETTESGFQPANSPNKQAIQRELIEVHARGGTHLTDALQSSGAIMATLEDLPDSGELEKIAILITDGAYGDEATAAFHRENDFKDVRFIAVAIGEDANGFLEALAANGTCVYVTSEATLSAASAKVQSRVDSPMHEGVRLTAPGLADQTPHIAPNIYPHVRTTLAGRMTRPKAHDRVEVTSNDGVITSLEIVISDDESATTRWANAHLKSMDYGLMTSNDEPSARAHSEQELVSHSIRYRILSKYTAWLAVDYSRTVDQAIVQKVASAPAFNDRGLIRSWNSSMGMNLMIHAHSLNVNPLSSPVIHRSGPMDATFTDDFLKQLLGTFGEETIDAEKSVRWHWLSHLKRLLSVFRRVLTKMRTRFQRPTSHRRR